MSREDDSNALKDIYMNTEDTADILDEICGVLEKLCTIVICSTIVIVLAICLSQAL